MKSKQLEPSDIAVLTGQGRDRCILFDKDTLAGCAMVRADEAGDPRAIVCDTVRRFKGLEAKCIIVIDIDHLLEPELIYVARKRPVCPTLMAL